MITEEQIRNLANKFQIDHYSILREYLQLIFLKYFYEAKESQKVYFKGGTAIHFLYGSFRFSEDLDFTSLITISELRALLKEVLLQMESEAGELELVNLGIKEHALTEIIKYRHGLKHPLTIRLEFSLRERPLTHQISPIETQFPIAPYPLVVHMDIEELLAEKIRALLTRHKGRDLFDLWFFLSKGVKLREDYIENKMRWYKMKYDFSNVVSAVQRYRQEGLEDDLRKFLPRNYRPFIKEIKIKTMEKLTTKG